MHPFANLDRRFVWHPFTQMRDWLKREPIVIVRGRGAVLEDARGRKYLDANSSIWTNLHGHNHLRINAAIRSQLRRIAHSSALGFANQPASVLAGRLVAAANLPTLERDRSTDNSPASKDRVGKAGEKPGLRRTGMTMPSPPLQKVFFSDDGSTALEVALKLAYEFSRRTGGSKNTRFLGLEGAYHGDTVGAVSLGHIDLFHKAYSGLLFKTDKVMAPYCYRCPYNRAKPERADAREYRKCSWECLDRVEQKFTAQKRKGGTYSAFVFEPLMQGAAGMIAQPAGWLGRACEIARGHGALLIADEVMTGFGRTGGILPGKGTSRAAAKGGSGPAPLLFACHQEKVQPDFMALAKGLTGGYLPMAATLTTQRVFDAFLGEYEEFKTFFHGHSYTGNQLGAAAALASLDVLQTPACARAREQLRVVLGQELQGLWKHPQVGDVRQVGLVAGVELVKDWRTREGFDLREQAGIRVCEAMARRGVLTRPVGNVVVLMPPYCTRPGQVREMVAALRESIVGTFGRKQAEA